MFTFDLFENENQSKNCIKNSISYICKELTIVAMVHGIGTHC